ncbi:MAG: hypothetical protein LBH99_03575 [Rickettsia sp.]|jgi:hypothetical protein|nr:hypothetical protein [Rickettsia sp.]
MSKQHPTDFIHGLLSSHVYTNSKEGEIVRFSTSANKTSTKYDSADYNALLTDWHVHRIYGDTTKPINYYGVLYVNDSAKQAVLAYRGVDVIASLKGKHGSLKAACKMLNKEIGSQQQGVHISTKDAVDIVHIKGYNLSLTGHALGGWLAEIGLYFCHKDFSCDIRDNIKSVTFDSPGTAGQIKSYKSSIENSDTNDISASLNTVTYLSAPNLINICHGHIGKVYRLFLEIPPIESAEYVRGLLSHLPKFVAEKQIYIDALLATRGDNLDLMLATFDSTTGKPNPSKYREVLDWPSIQYSSNPIDYGSKAVKVAVKVGLQAAGVPNFIAYPIALIAQGVSKLTPTTTYGSLTKAIVSFLTNDNKLDQLFEAYKRLDITKPDLGYPALEKQLDGEGFYLKYKGHYRVDTDEVNPNKASVPLQDGTLEWYLMKLCKCSEVDIGGKFTQSITKELLALREQYDIEPPNNKGMRVIMSKSSSVEELKDQMSSLIKSDDDIRKVLGGVASETPIENIILEMQEEAAEWVKTCSANNVMKAEGESNHRFINKIEKLVTQLAQEKIQTYFLSKDVSPQHLLNSIYGMNALANYYLYNEHKGEKAREILLSSKKLAEQYVLNRSVIKFDFDSLSEQETYTNLKIITDLPEMYTGIIYLLARTYMYQGDKTEAIPYFKLSKYLGNELKLFEGYLSDRGKLTIEREKIDWDIKNEVYDHSKATIELTKIAESFQKLKNDHTEYKEGYKPGIGENSKVIPAKDVYNQVECSEQLAKCYMQLIMLTDNEEQHEKYVAELSNQFIGSDELPGMLKQLGDVLPKKAASIYNSLGNILLKLCDQNIKFHDFKVAISEKLLLSKVEELTARDDLTFIHKIFTLAKEESRQGEFTKADAHDGLRMVCERQLKQENLEEAQRENLLKLKLEHEKIRDEINKILSRNIKYESSSAESDIKLSDSTDIEVASTATTVSTAGGQESSTFPIYPSLIGADSSLHDSV